MDDISCSGNEKYLGYCKFNNVSNCYHSEDVVVTCSSIQNLTMKWNFRLANPRNITINGNWNGVWGRAEEFDPESNSWNPICDKDFT